MPLNNRLKEYRAKKNINQQQLGIGGGIGGIVMLNLNTAISVASNLIKGFIYTNGYILSMVLSVIMVVLTIALTIFIRQSTASAKIKTIALMAEDNSDELEKIEKKQLLNLWIANSLFILHFFFFSITIFMSKKSGGSPTQILIMTLTVTTVLVAGTLTIIKTQQKIIDLLKVMNPEKQGSIYDFKFNKKWEESSDEAELMKTYRAGYKAYKAVTNFLLILW